MCSRCISEDTYLELVREYSTKWYDYILDFFKIFSWNARWEQSTKTKWASRLKIKLEKELSHQGLRRLIHALGSEGTELHEEFNRVMSQPALVLEAVVLGLMGIVAGIVGVVAWVGCRRQEIPYEELLIDNVYLPQHIHDQLPQGPVEILTNGEMRIYPVAQVPLEGHITPATSMSKAVLLTTKDEAWADDFNRGRTNVISITGPSSGHLELGAARTEATNYALNALGSTNDRHSILVIGESRNSTIACPILMMSNNGNRGGAVHANSGIIRNPLTPSTLASLSLTIPRFERDTATHVTGAYARDVLHDPVSLDTFLNLLSCENCHFKTAVMIGMFPMVPVNDPVTYRTREMVYTIEPSGIDGWCLLKITISGEQTFS